MAVCFALFLYVVGSLIHQLTGVVAYPAWELPSKSSYAPTSMPPTTLGAPHPLPSKSSYAPTSMPPTTLGAPHSSSNTEHQVVMSPPLAPLGTGSGSAESPSPTIPYAPPPVLESAPNAGYPWKPLGINTSSPPHPVPTGPVLPLPVALPPKPTHPPLAIGVSAEAPQPRSGTSQHIRKEHKQIRKDSPSTENWAPPLPGAGPISPLPATLLPKSTLPPLAIRGPAEAPQPLSATSQYMREELLPNTLLPKSTLPLPATRGPAEAPQPPSATSQHMYDEHKHTRKDSPFMENQTPNLPRARPIPPLSVALPPKSTHPPLAIEELAKAPQSPSATSQHIHEEHKRTRKDSSSMENQEPRMPGAGPISPFPAALPPKSTLPPPATGGQAEAPQPPSATSEHKHEEHKHTRKDSPSTENQAPHLPRIGPISPPPATLPPNSIFPPPAIGWPAAPQPPSATSQQRHKEHKHTGKDSPSTENQAPRLPGIAPVPSPLTALQWTPPVIRMGIPGMAPTTTSDPAVSPASNSPSDVHRKISKMPAAPAPLRENFNHSSPVNHSSTMGVAPVISAPPQEGLDLSPSNHGTSPPTSFSNPKPPEGKRIQDPAPAPAVSFHKNHAQKNASNPLPVPAPSTSFHEYHARKDASSPASAPSHLFPSPSYHKGPVIPLVPLQAPMVLPNKSRHRSATPAASTQGPLSPRKTPFSPKTNQGAPAPLRSLIAPSSHVEVPVYPPAISSRKPRMPLLPPAHALPPPPPNKDCVSILCTDPLTNTPPGAPCRCVMPVQVGLCLGVGLLTFFPLVSELAKEVASGVFMNQSQVRIMGANTAIQDPDQTDVILDLVPLGEEFGYNTAFMVYKKFWHKQVDMKSSLFGDYRVLFVHYPGLPPSPPSALTDITIEETGQLPHGNPSRTKQPLAADFRKRKDRLDGGLIAFIVLSSTILLALFVGAIWLFLWKQRDNARQPEQSLQTLLPQVKPSGARSAIFGSESHSPSPSFSSSIAAYAGSAKTFSLGEIEKATNNFDDSTILGEGGFGCVYKGTIEDGTKVAVKVLKRDDHHGGREFLAEVEMLSRLHHRNLVKLIGICTEEHNRCLVYELIPNGSVESHLHGVDKEAAPLDWDARLKIALGSARGLAYLHEDSSPRVIHRDFKSSNILLEYDFTPKVSDFGLAKSALDEENEHISTRVMGTFGYVAPEYAMTGHLLVKSDVYSYGVVLLELLTGRKPVDMTQPPGQENLVNWARPLLTTKEGLQMIIDPALGPDIPFDSVAKVAAIASMCVQPEVSHRPFMGEVVQALKLVCNECDEKKAGSGSYSQDLSAQDTDTRISIASGQLPESHSFMMSNYGSSLEAERALSTSGVFSSSARFTRHESASFRRHFSSGPLRTTRRGWFWWRGLSSGSVSEHGFPFKLWARSESDRRLPQ